VGTILLGGITSLPEIATTGTAAATGNAALAVNTLLGKVAKQESFIDAGIAVTEASDYPPGLFEPMMAFAIDSDPD